MPPVGSFYVYVLFSEVDKHFYVGYTNDLDRRFVQHRNGEVSSTRHRRPLILVYWEGCLRQSDATRREKYLKTAWGKRYLKTRIRDYLTG